MTESAKTTVKRFVALLELMAIGAAIGLAANAGFFGMVRATFRRGWKLAVWVRWPQL
jgi:hypothetical protein